MAIRQRGYISGETLRELIDPSLFKIISTWSTLKDWKKWQASSQRLLIEEKLDSITNNGRTLRIFTADYKKTDINSQQPPYTVIYTNSLID
jgi:heme-degrading monooxygenase HmoA